jgi:hypothetical protein
LLGASGRLYHGACALCACVVIEAYTDARVQADATDQCAVVTYAKLGFYGAEQDQSGVSVHIQAN